MRTSNRTHDVFTSSREGSSLLTVMVLSGVLGVGALAISSKMHANAKLGEMSKGSLARDLIAFQLRKATYVKESYYNALRASDVLTENPDLYHCFSGDDTTPQCASLDSSRAPIVHPLRLYSVSGSSGGTPEAISDGGASDAQPIYWNIQGQVCKGANAASCPFEVSTTFTALCQDGSALCTQAYTFALTYVVQINPKIYSSVVQTYGALAQITAQSPLYYVYQYYIWDFYPIMPLPYGVAPTGTVTVSGGGGVSCGGGLVMSNGKCSIPTVCSAGQVVINGRCVNAVL